MESNRGELWECSWAGDETPEAAVKTSVLQRLLHPSQLDFFPELWSRDHSLLPGNSIWQPRKAISSVSAAQLQCSCKACPLHACILSLGHAISLIPSQ